MTRHELLCPRFQEIKLLPLPAVRRAQLSSAARKIRFLEVDGGQSVEGGGEEEGLGGGGRPAVLLQQQRGGASGSGEEGGGKRRREGREPIHGRQPGAAHRPRHRPAVSEPDGGSFSIRSSVPAVSVFQLRAPDIMSITQLHT